MDLKSLQNNTYTVLVAGNVDLSKYDINKKVTPYVVYEYKNRNEIRKKVIGFYDEYIKSLHATDSNSVLKNILSMKMQDIIEMTDEEYFDTATNGMMFDEETGNAMTDFNPDGKYSLIEDANKEYAMPLVGDKFKCKVKDLPPKSVDEKNVKIYEEHWDNVMKYGSSLKEEYKYFYKDKETYVNVMTEPLFYNAFVSDETGWLEQTPTNQIEWVLTFRENFIDKLDKETDLKVYNFKR